MYHFKTTKSQNYARNFFSRASRPKFTGEVSVDPKVLYPRLYFDFKAFRKTIADKKHSLIEAEEREVRRAYAKPPPSSEWNIER